MTEQLSIFAGETPSESISDKLPPAITPSETEYEDLDYQLANLLVELNDFQPDDPQQKIALNKLLKSTTLEISKYTREGQIYLEISADHQAQLQQTTVVGLVGDYMPLIIDQGYLYLHRYWQYQQRLADQINHRIQDKEQLNQEQQAWATKRLSAYFGEDNLNQINWQKRAAELALEHKFLIVSGGPGTGKTTTITRLLSLLIEQKLKENNDTKHVVENDQKVGGVFSNDFNILLAAPTGKAAIRMLDSLREASNQLQASLDLDQAIIGALPSSANTVHKLLGYIPNSAQFKHNKNNPLVADVVLVDEASMIDIALMSKLIEAVPAHAKLILIGDKDQLASVETGSVFADICDGLKDINNLVTLKKNWRFAEDSDIGQTAIAANQGSFESMFEVFNDPVRTGVELIPPNKIKDADLILPWQNYFSVLNNEASTPTEIFAAFNQYRILCALRRGFNGSETMNERIEAALQKKTWIERRRSASLQNQFSSWYHGRPIIISQNNYSRGLMNGDTGITLIKNGEIKVYFPSTDGEFLSFSPVRLPAHQTSWSMTIHKSQGSEFDQVALILPHEEIPLLTRQLIYTGITRAKNKVTIVASPEVLEAGVKSEISNATLIENYITK